MTIEKILELAFDKAPVPVIMVILVVVFLKHIKTLSKSFATTIKEINAENRDDRKKLEAVISDNTRQTSQCTLVMTECTQVMRELADERNRR